ncbi:hypothetical protein NDA18_001373 [Ustilago nuda]|nr:hypothetical protein NDA18_001373 [Ustilago nuda]
MVVILPDEVIYHIFSYLDPRSLGIALQCSNTFYRIATSSALWEQPYFLRWVSGDPKREEQRGTNQWRRQKKLRRLEEHARRAATEKQLPLASETESPFRYLQLVDRLTKQPSDGSLPAPAKIDFYRLFVERIQIDQEVIDTLYQQVEATHGRIPAITSLALRFANDATDVLTAIVEAQSSCPSWSPSGLTSSSRSAASNENSGKDALAYDSTGYRLKAYHAHLPTTLRSDTHHLVILHHAREMLEHQQRREAMQIMKKLSVDAAEDNQPGSLDHFEPSATEKAVSMLTMFRGGEAKYVEAQIDLLAAACDLYLQQRLPILAEQETQRASAFDKAKEMATAICDFLADHGFRGAQGDLFSDLDNHFLHHCFTTNRETLPLSLTLIFCGVANRLGLQASLCNFPMRILAFVCANPTVPWPGPEDSLTSAPHGLFWLDVCEYTTVAYDAHEPTPTEPFARRPSWLQQRPPILDRADLTEWIGRMGIPPTDDFWRPAAPSSMVQRAARNILSSVQRAQILPRTMQLGGQARSAIRNMELNRRSARLEQQWSQLVRVDHSFLSSLHGRTDAAKHEAMTSRVAAALESEADIAEDETVWNIVRSWRSESMRSLTSAPDSWIKLANTPSELFREWMQHRAADNDWTRVRDHLHRRADHWSEHEQQAAKYAAVNAFLRLSTQVNAREVDWIAGFLQSYFMLDVEVIETDFLGASQADSTNSMDEDGADSEGSESSDEAGVSIREAREGTPREGLVTNPSARIVLARMLQAVRAKDSEAPRVNRRSGPESRRQRQFRASVASPTEQQEDDTGEEEDLISYRVGTIFRHRTYHYAGAILGWDPYCAAPEDWIVNMGVDRLPASSGARRGGRHQPFYHSQVADGTRRYVAEVNVEPVSGPIWIYGTPSTTTSGDKGEVPEEGRALGASLHAMLQLRGLGEYFRCFDQERGKLRRNRDARVMFPDDWSDDDFDDEDEEKAEEREVEEEMELERLSEDGSW